MYIVLSIVAILFLVGACCSVVMMERHGRLDLVRRAPLAQHPLGIRFKLISHPALVPVLLILVTWNGILAVVTLGWHVLGMISFISRANNELRSYAERYWSNALQGGSSVDQCAQPPTRTTGDVDECSPTEALASDASTLAGHALEAEGLEASNDHPNAGIVDRAVRGQYSSFSLYLQCLETAERGVTDANLIAKMAIGEMATMLDSEVQCGNMHATKAQQACHRAFLGMKFTSTAA